LPVELVSRLEAQELTWILRHELMHVRRLDYLWDRAATLGCYLVFFHPAAWFVRRQLRRDRELVCDDAAVDRTDLARIDYAACLTAMARLRFSGAGVAGPVDFLSSPSLLSARVRAMVSPQPRAFSGNESAMFACLAAVSIVLAIRTVPEATFTPTALDVAESARPSELISDPAQVSQPISIASPKHLPQRRKLPVAKARVHHVQPVSAPAAQMDERSLSTVASPSHAQAKTDSRRAALWHFVPKFGGWAVHSMKAGFSKVGSHLSRDRRREELSEQLPPEAPDRGTR
jgi:hypothetical protein